MGLENSAQEQFNYQRPKMNKALRYCKNSNHLSARHLRKKFNKIQEEARYYRGTRVRVGARATGWGLGVEGKVRVGARHRVKAGVRFGGRVRVGAGVRVGAAVRVGLGLKLELGLGLGLGLQGRRSLQLTDGTYFLKDLLVHASLDKNKGKLFLFNKYTNLGVQLNIKLWT